MLCSSPFIKEEGRFKKYKKVKSYGSVQIFPCNQCLNCRINHARLWKNRILLEAKYMKYSYYVTLTYNDIQMPTKVNTTTGEEYGILNKKDLSNYLKRLRKSHEPHKLRFYACGEYGETKWRPHFHLAIFSNEQISRGDLTKAWRFTDLIPLCGPGCEDESCYCKKPLNQQDKGFVKIGDIANGSAAYIAGYVQKKASNPYIKGIGDRPQAYATMSKANGGIGIGVVNEIAKVFSDNQVSINEVRDYISLGKKKLPLGRHLTRALAKKLNIKEAKFKERFFDLLNEYEECFHPKTGKDTDTGQFINNLIDHFKGKRDSVINRTELFTAKRT